MFTVVDLPPAPKGQLQVEVMLSVNVDGIVNCTATAVGHENVTGSLEEKVLVEKVSVNLTEEQIEELSTLHGGKGKK